MSVCSNCSETIDKHRAHLGYTECLDCSQIEHYSAHTVYPHKTGGYVQPVSKTTSNNLKRIDRRSVGRTRVGKSSGDWDKWLEKYYHDLYNPKPEKKPIKDVCTITHITEDKLTTIQYYIIKKMVINNNRMQPNNYSMMTRYHLVVNQNVR